LGASEAAVGFDAGVVAAAAEPDFDAAGFFAAVAGLAAFGFAAVSAFGAVG
jgi:hypothetical protein